jgi:lipoprotein NlpD
MNSARRVLLVVAVAALAGCSSTVVREAPSGHRAPSRRASVPKPGATTLVERGDTLYSIATRNGISVLDLASWNSLPPPYTIYPGQRLRLYPGGSAVAAVPSRPRPARPPAAAGSAPKPTPPVVLAPPSSPFAWRWPADGTVVNRFTAGEPTRQGVDIAGSEGAAVRAAEDGTVV